jgi:uncharacterized protein YaiI (UPF0178 family)
MKKVSRRRFVIGASAGAVVVGASVGIPTAIVNAQNSSSQHRATAFASKLATPLTAYVRDAAKGEIVLLANNNQIVITDLDLAARLLNAAQ